MIELGLGATVLPEQHCRFRVWAPAAGQVELQLVEPRTERVVLERVGDGYHEAVLPQVPPGSRYFYRLDGGPERPDPASRLQPDGVHGPSQVVDPAFPWTDGTWRGLPLAEHVLYELHIGTFTAEGTCEAVIPLLPELAALGVTALELMPVAQFPGTRNWGYDGAFPFAVQQSYGGPQGLQRLVDAAHRQGLAVVLDVVYNHLGPEGAYLHEYGPYFTDRYRTPWGMAVNFDGPDSDAVRRYFIENALYWVRCCHIDALRLDAVHAIFDTSPRPFLEELAGAVQEEARHERRLIHLFEENDRNDSRALRSAAHGGAGPDAQWNDDLHHALHTLLTGERSGYYQDFGELRHLGKAMAQGYVYTGQRSLLRRRAHGSPSSDLPPHRFVVFSQNHDQVGNRAQGERLSRLVPFEALKLAAGLVILSPYLPLLFMGEEYGELAPFPYFISHGDAELIEAVRAGRRREFASFAWGSELPDPQDEATFRAARLDHGLKGKSPHRQLHELYRTLLELRRTVPALACCSRERQEVMCWEKQRVLLLRRFTEEGDEALLLAHPASQTVELELPVPAGRWRRVLCTADTRWAGPGSPNPEALRSDGALWLAFSPWSLLLLRREGEDGTTAA